MEKSYYWKRSENRRRVEDTTLSTGERKNPSAEPYGSRARSTASPDSDFDLLVIEADPVSKWDEMRRLRQAMYDFPYPVDVWVMGETEFEETKSVVGGLAYPAHKYGVVLYENT